MKLSPAILGSLERVQRAFVSRVSYAAVVLVVSTSASQAEKDEFESRWLLQGSCIAQALSLTFPQGGALELIYLFSFLLFPAPSLLGWQ